MSWQVFGLAALAFGCLFIIWRLIAGVRGDQKQIREEKARADTAEGMVRSGVEARGMEEDAKRAADEARKNALKTPWLAFALACLLCLGGCEERRSQPVGFMPIYHVVPPPAFTPEEEAVLTDFASNYPEIYVKIKAYSDGNKAIILAHNKRAKEINRQRLKEMNVSEDELKAWLGPEEIK